MKIYEFEGKQIEVDDEISDEEVLSLLENQSAFKNPPAEAPKNRIKKLGQSALAAGQSMPAALLNVGRAAVELPSQAVQALGDVMGIENPVDPFKAVGDVLAKGAEGYEARAKATRPDVSEENALMQGVLNAPESLVQNLTTIAGSMATGGPVRSVTQKAVGGMAALVGGEAYGEARAQDKTPLEAAIYGGEQAVAEAAFELMPVGKLLKDIEKNVNLKSLVLNQLAREIPTEQATTLVQDFNTWANLNPEKTLKQFLDERPAAAMQTLGATIAQSGTTSAVLYGGSKAAAKMQKSEQDVQREVEAMVREAGLVLDDNANDMIEMNPIYHTNNETNEQTKTPTSAPFFQNEDGTFENQGESELPELRPTASLPIAGEGVKLIDGNIESNLDTGEIALSDEAIENLKSNNFANPEEAIRLTALAQLRSAGTLVVHEIDELGKTKSTVIPEVETLVAQIESLKSEQGLPVEKEFAAKSLNDVFDTSYTDGLLSRDEELRYRMLNPMTAERKAQLLEKANREAELANLPDSMTPTDVEYLDNVWQLEVQKGTFEPQSEDTGGITDEVAANREERYVPEILPPSLRTISVASVPSAEGLTLRKLDRQAGTFGIGGNEKSFPREYQEAVVAIVEKVRAKYMSPDTMLVINFENFGGDKTVFGETLKDEVGNTIASTMGAHFRLGDGTHVITPRELASWDKVKGGYNKLTVNEALRSLSHELGHAVWLNEFFRDVDANTALVFQTLFARDDVDEIRRLVNTLPEAQRAVVNEWLTMREGVKTQSARWFVENWLGVRKLGLGVGKYARKSEQSIYSWAERELAKRDLRLDGASALDLVHSIAWDESVDETEAKAKAEQYVLSFNEYMAEQFTRHAYTAKIEESVLAKNPFFMRALNALRLFFRELKTTFGENAESIVKAGESFESWVTGLSFVYSSVENEKLLKNAKAKTKRKIVSQAKEKKPKAKKPKSETVIAAENPVVEVINEEAVIKELKKMLVLVRRQDEGAAEAIADAIEAGDYEFAKRTTMEVLRREINFDANYSYRLHDELQKISKNGIVKRKALDDFLKKNWKQSDKQAIVELLTHETYGVLFSETIPLRDIEMTLAANNIHITTEETSDYSDWGWNVLGGADPLNVRTVLLKGNVRTNFLSHFEYKRNYVGHFRVEKADETLRVIEVQSDLLQKLDSNRDVYEKKNKRLREDEPRTYAKLKALQRDWQNRVLGEIAAYAQENEFKRVGLILENSLALAEGWISQSGIRLWHTKNNPMEFVFSFKDIRLEGTDGDNRLSGNVRYLGEINENPQIEFEIINNYGVVGYTDLESMEDTLDEAFEGGEWRDILQDIADAAHARFMQADLIKFETEPGRSILQVPIKELKPVGEYQATPYVFADGLQFSGKVKILVDGDTESKYLLYEILTEDGNIPQQGHWRFEHEMRQKLQAEPEDRSIEASDVFTKVREVTMIPSEKSLIGIYRRHRELVDLAKRKFGGQVENWGKNYNTLVFDVKPEYANISLDMSTPNAQVASRVIKTMKKLKNAKINQSMNFVARTRMALTQLQQLAAENPNILPLQVFNKLTQDYAKLKNQMLFRPNQVANDWIKLNESSAKLLDKVLRAEQATGEHQTRLVKNGSFFVHEGSAELDAWLTSLGVDLTTTEGEKIREIFLKIKNTHLHQLNVLEAVLRDILWKKFGRNTAVFSEKWNEFAQVFSEMRGVVFLPNMQFGNYVVYVKEKIQQPDGGFKVETTYRRHFESQSERNDFFEELKQKATPLQQVWRKDLSESEGVILAIPFDFVQALADTEVFSQDQINLMIEMLIPTKAEKFEKRWREVANTLPGGSENLFRNFAAYTWHNANFVSKLKYNQDFNRAISALRTERNAQIKLKKIDNATIDFYENLLNRMIDVKSYLMYPPAEFEGLRSAISLMYLSFVAKTALMNLTTTMHTIFAAQTEYGDVTGSKAFISSMKLLKSVWGKPDKNGTLRFSAIEERIKNSQGKEQDYWKKIKFAMDKATLDGVIDQSYAYMLAGMATSETRMKLLQKLPQSQYAFQGLDAGMSVFRLVEKTNRLLSLMTFFELEINKGTEMTLAYERATQKTLLLQNDYTRANRIKLMQGGKSLLTIFLSYAQFMGWIMTGGYDRSLKAAGGEVKSPLNFTTRMWIVYALLGGSLGLPFAENIMDLLTLFCRKYLNIANPEYEMRKLIDETIGHENLIMHGLLHNVSTPFGDVDLSASFGLGRLIPGTEPIATADQMTAAEFAGKEMLALSGVTGSFFKSLWDMASANSLEEGLRAMPGQLGNIGKALTSYENGVMTKNGVRLNRDPETGEFVKESPELAMLQLMGFNPAEASAARKQNALAYEIAKYYATKQSMLLLNRNKAVLYGDNEAKRDAEADISEYNSTLPEEFTRLRITGKTKAESFKNYRTRIKKAEAGKAPNRKNEQIYSAVKNVSDE